MKELKFARKHFSKLGLMFFLGTIIIYAVQLILMVIIMLVKPQWLENMNIYLMISVLPMYLVGMPVLIALVKRLPAETPERRPMKAGSFAVAALMCFALVYISNIVGNLLTTIIGLIKGSMVQNQLFEVTANVSLWLILIYMVICAPIMEEYVFRKLIVDRTIRYGQGVAIVVSGLMFGLFHGNLNQFVYAFVLGMFLAFLYVKTGKLKIVIALHMMINFMGGLVSSGILKLIDLEKYAEVMSSGDIQLIWEYAMDNLPGLVLYGLFYLFVIAVMIAGGVLLIVSLVKGRFALKPAVMPESEGAAPGSEAVIPKGKKFSVVFLNLGMILYSVFWIAIMIYQLML